MGYCVVLGGHVETRSNRGRRQSLRVGFSVVLAVLSIDFILSGALFADECHRMDIHSRHLESVFVDSDMVVVGAKPDLWGTTMRAVELETRRERWQARAHFTIASAIFPSQTLGFPRDVALQGGHVLSVGTDGFLEARAKATGELQWRLKITDDSLWKVSVSNGKAFIAGRDGSVSVVDLDARAIVWSKMKHEAMVRSVVYAPALGAVVSAGFDGLVAVSNEADGGLLWEMSFPFRIKSALYSHGLVLVAPWREDGADVKAYSFDKKNLIWARSWHDQLADGYRGKHHGVEEMIVHDGQVFTAGDDGQVVAADAASGRPLWDAVGSGQSARSVTVSNGNLVFVDRGGVLTICALP